MTNQSPKELRQQAKWTRIFAEMKRAEAAQMDKAAEAAEQLAEALELGKKVA